MCVMFSRKTNQGIDTSILLMTRRLKKSILKAIQFSSYSKVQLQVLSFIKGGLTVQFAKVVELCHVYKMKHDIPLYARSQNVYSLILFFFSMEFKIRFVLAAEYMVLSQFECLMMLILRCLNVVLAENSYLQQGKHCHLQKRDDCPPR